MKNMSALGNLQKDVRSASAKQGAATRAYNAQFKPFAPNNPSKAEELLANQQRAIAANNKAKEALGQAGIKRNTGFWGKQLANTKNGFKSINAGQKQQQPLQMRVRFLEWQK